MIATPGMNCIFTFHTNVLIPNRYLIRHTHDTCLNYGLLVLKLPAGSMGKWIVPPHISPMHDQQPQVLNDQQPQVQNDFVTLWTTEYVSISQDAWQNICLVKYSSIIDHRKNIINVQINFFNKWVMSIGPNHKEAMGCVGNPHLKLYLCVIFMISF